MQKELINKPLPRTRQKGLVLFCRIASFLFHPLFMTPAAAVILYKFAPGNFSGNSFPLFRNWFGELLVFTILFPLLSILIFKISGLISNARMHLPRDRVLPLIATMVFYLLAYILLTPKYHVPILFKSMLLGSTASIFLIFAINFFYKVSIHTAAVAILPGITMVIMLNNNNVPGWVFLTAVGIACLVGTIRWLLGAHTLGQILLGYVVGTLFQLVFYFCLNT